LASTMLQATGTLVFNHVIISGMQLNYAKLYAL